MKESFPAESEIREYLLGRLDNQPEIENKLGEQIFLDDELSEIVDSIEEEIIEEYLDGTLGEADKKDVEEYFLRPPERKEKLRFARLLREGVPQTDKKDKDDRSLKQGPVLVVSRNSHYRTYVALAALVLLVVSIVVLAKRGHEHQSSTVGTTIQSQAPQEHQQPANPPNGFEPSGPAVVTVTFFGFYRDKEDIPVAEIKPSTQQVKVEIDLQGADRASYDVRVQTAARQPIWSQAGVKPTAGALSLEIPAQNFSTGRYCVYVSSRVKPYCFEAKAGK